MLEHKPGPACCPPGGTPGSRCSPGASLGPFRPCTVPTRHLQGAVYKGQGLPTDRGQG